MVDWDQADHSSNVLLAGLCRDQAKMKKLLGSRFRSEAILEHWGAVSCVKCTAIRLTRIFDRQGRPLTTTTTSRTRLRFGTPATFTAPPFVSIPNTLQSDGSIPHVSNILLITLVLWSVVERKLCDLPYAPPLYIRSQSEFASQPSMRRP